MPVWSEPRKNGPENTGTKQVVQGMTKGKQRTRGWGWRENWGEFLNFLKSKDFLICLHWLHLTEFSFWTILYTQIENTG